MGAFEVVFGSATNPRATITECTAAAGQNFQVKASDANATLNQIWGFNASGGIIRVRSPRMHDDVQGIRARVNRSLPQVLLPYDVAEQLYSTDTLIVETSGGEAETDNVFLLIHYPALPGSEGRLMHDTEVMPNIDAVIGVELSARTGAVGRWGAPIALNTSMDLFQRPRNYAILGYQLSAACGAIVFSGTDVGPLRHGGPGMEEPDVTSEWFVGLARESKQAAIPVFNSQNVGQVNVELGGQTAEAESKVTVILGRLRS